MAVHTPEPLETAPATERLRAGSIGAAGITFFVVAAAAPLTCVIAITPLILGFGAGASAPLVYLIVGAILMLFAVGYVAMSRRVPNPGALYSYIAHGLGPSAGIGAAFVSVLAYVVSQVCLCAFFGYALSGLLEAFFGWSVSWYVCCLLALALAMVLGRKEISMGAKVLGVMLVAEVAILVVLAIAVIAQGGAQGIEFSAFNPQGLLVAGVGVSLAFAYGSYIGFEQTAIYAEEAKGPKSVRRATYAAILATTIFYAFITWVIISAFGAETVVEVAVGSPATLVFDAGSEYLGPLAVSVMEILVVTSALATVLSFHNATSRYLYALGREGVMPRALGRSHPRTQSPYRASIVVGLINAVVLGVFWITGVDPYLGVFTWGSASSAVGFIALQAVCSAAVFRYFQVKAKGAENTWTGLVSPVLAFLLLTGMLVLILSNFSSLVGFDVGPVAMLVPAVYLVAGVSGIVYGLRIKRAAPAVWAGVGHGAPETP